MDNLAIVVQGQSKHVRLMKKHLTGHNVIYSAWTGEESEYSDKDIVIFNEIPKHSGPANFNFQKISTTSGLKKAKELGFNDLSEVEAYQKLKSTQPDLIANLINSMENHFPEEVVEDFEERILETTKTLGTASEVKIVEGIIRERKNYKETHSEMKEYVRSKYYVGEVMKCQACSLIMPFKLFSGRYYFEAVYFIKTLDREFRANGVALCPTCAAKFKYTLQTTPDELRRLVLNLSILGTGSSTIRISMSGSECDLSFTDDHLIELQTILKDNKI